MSSDDLFDDDEYDDAFFEELDAIQSKKPSSSASPPGHSTTRAPNRAVSEQSFDDLTFDFDDEELEQVDKAVAEKNKIRSIASSSTTTGHRQTTLFGQVLPHQAQDKTKGPSRTSSGQAPKIKHWDRTEFAKSGIRKAKGKDRASISNNDEEEDEDVVEFEQFPAPFVSLGPPPPMKLMPDLLEAKHWIYPLNQPKRDYQFNIVKHCLFENTIVALPTGLGKTFVAGVVMLNFYRWFPEGKVVFVAPTKPLVAQQIDASHKSCGIPGSDAVELTGQNPKPMRARAWNEKRVFYMTPQTFINDLLSETCDASSIILIVIDEAHRATGDYAYNQVIRYMMAKNPHFRILALTATPGSNTEAVQNLIDGLHISRIEIRDENSLDLKAYIYEKKIEQHVIKMSDEITVVQDLLVKFMQNYSTRLSQIGLAHPAGNLKNVHPYAFQARMGNVPKGAGWAFSFLSMMSALSRIMGYLVEGTMKMCHDALQELPDDDQKGDSKKEGGSKDQGNDKKATTKSKLRGDSAYQAVMKELERHNGPKGFPVHPKMDRLKSLILQHLTQHLPDDPEGEPRTSTKIMVFATYRPCVEEIVEYLNAENPLIRATRFIGQGTDKAGRKGLAQREQLEVIQKFKDDEYNVLVATSIGEEGLDIGEVDLIVCYDAQKTPIRMLQRLGRTGRKRAGVVHVLLSEGREEFNMDKAKDTYKNVQKTIWSGNQLELYADVERLLPDHIHPECLEKRMEIQEYIRQETSRKKSLKKDSGPPEKKRKRNADVDRNIPIGASADFVTASKLVIKKSKKAKKVKLARDLEMAGEDDDIDRDIEMGLSVLEPPPRRTQSDTTSRKTKRTGKVVLRKAKTGESSKSSTKRPKFSASQGVDDSDDMAIERGLTPPLCFGSGSAGRKWSPYTSTPRKTTEDVIDLTDSDHEDEQSLAHSPAKGTSLSLQIGIPKSKAADMSWLLDDDDDEKHDSFAILSSSPSSETHNVASSSRHLLQPSPSRPPPEDMSLLVISDSDIDLDPPEAHISSLPNVSSPGPSYPMTCPVRAPGEKKRKRRDPLPSEPDSNPCSPVRLRRHKSLKHKRKESHLLKRNIVGVWDEAAIHSGDETSEGSSGSGSERESDREFLKELPETQVSPSYAQTQAYRRSLMTQAPNDDGPRFARPPQRRSLFDTSAARRLVLVSSSPTRPDGEVDEYEFDSFLVHDDSQIVYEDEE